jgi:hypothetical protein
MMTVKRWVKAVFITAGLSAVLISQPPRFASALSCSMILSIEVNYEKYDGVILARLMKVTRTEDDPPSVQVRVLQSYKGVTDSRLSIRGLPFWGEPSQEGQTYLFFLNKTEAGWEYPICSPVSPEENMTAWELAFLKEKEIPLNEVSESSGRRVWMITGGALLLFALLGYGTCQYIRRHEKYL